MIWKTRRLPEVAELVLGKMLDQKKNKGDPRPYLANINVRWGNFDLSDLREMRFEPHEYDRYGLRCGDIVMCEGGEPGRCAIWRDQVPGMMIQKALHRIRAKSAIHPDFLFYCLMQQGRSGELDRLFTGSTIQHLPGEQLAKVEVPVPSIAVQRRIASVLSAYDDLIENNTRRIAILEEMARRLFEKIRSESAASSETISLGEIADRVGGLVKTGPFGSQLHESDYTQEGVPVVMPKDIIGGRVSTASIARIDEETAKRLNHHQLLEGDIVYGRRGDIGRRALIRRLQVGYLCGTGCLRISVHGDVIAPRYLFAYLGLPEVIAEIAGKAVGATMPNLNTSILRGVQIQVPPMKAQKRYVEAAADLDDLAETLLEANQRLRAARDLLLPKLISGEIDVSRTPLPLEIAAE